MYYRRCFSSSPSLLVNHTGQRTIVEKLWREFFSNPSKWCDHRSEKVHPKYPDFKHKTTQAALWLNGNWNPPWVEEQVAALPAGAVEKNSFPYNVKFAEYVKAGQYEKTLELYKQMQEEGINPDKFTFIRVLNACARLGALEEGKRLHAQIRRSDWRSDMYVGNSLVDMYAKCGSIEDAWRVFNKMPMRNVVTWNAMILGYVKCGQGHKALELSERMQSEQVEPGRATFLGLVNACASLRSLEDGRRIHTQIIRCGLKSDVFVSNSLVDMYSKCGSINEAWTVFNNMPKRDIVSFNSMISGLVKCGQGQKALDLRREMQRQGVRPDPVTYVGFLNACASVGDPKEGRNIHNYIIQSGCESDVYVGSSLVDMYAKCGSIDDAWGVFCNMPVRNVVSWNAMLLGHVKCGQAQKALELSQQMQQEGLQLNRVTFLVLLNACADLAAVEEGKRVHQQIVLSGLDKDLFVANSLIDMYAKCGCTGDAWRVFTTMPFRNVVAWNAMIWGYVRGEEAEKALELYGEMLREGVEPDPVTFVGVINACASLGTLKEGRHVHEHTIAKGCELDVFVGNSLIDMYAKCGSIPDAWTVFCKMPTRDVVSWNAMILGYVKCGEEEAALELSKNMQLERVKADPFTYVGLLNACAGLGSLEEGRKVHEQIIQSGWESNAFVGNSLVDMYAKCGSVEDAWTVFSKLPTRDVVSWSSMIQGYVSCGQAHKALELPEQMQQEGVKPDPVTFVGLLNACACLGALAEGKRIHEQIVQNGFESEVFVGNSLIDMYIKCGSIEDAWKVFRKMPSCDLVAWSAMIKGHVSCGQGHKALEIYKEMQQEGVEPDLVTFIGILNMCASIAALDEGRDVHKQILERGFESEVFVGNSLIDMYVKCGSIDDAWRVFNKIPTRTVFAWTAMLGGYALHGHTCEALGFFERMCQEGVTMDNITFLSLLSACSHGGLVDEGLHYFETMASVYCIPPTLKHYACMADLLGRAGRLHETEELIKSMSCEPEASVWMCLLGASRVHGDLELGERIAIRVLQLDPGHSGASVLLSNIYAAAGKWDSKASLRHERFQKLADKQDRSRAENNTHQQIGKIHRKLERLSEVGYVQHATSILLNVEEEIKVSHLCCHSESWPLHWLISKLPGIPLCAKAWDCHFGKR